MFERGFGVSDVRRVLDTGEIIEEYREDLPYPSRLVFGRAGERILHVVAGDAPDGETIVITVYVPDPDKWEPDLRTRKKR